MRIPSGLKSLLWASALLSAAPASLAEEAEFQAGKRYVVETMDGGVFTSEISASDEDSLYFLDGSSLPRTEVGTVCLPGAWTQGDGNASRSVHPGPETDPGNSHGKAQASLYGSFLEFLVRLIVAIVD